MRRQIVMRMIADVTEGNQVTIIAVRPRKVQRRKVCRRLRATTSRRVAATTTTASDITVATAGDLARNISEATVDGLKCVTL